MSSRVGIFIDGSNLYHALKNSFGRYDLNFAEFAGKLCGQRQLFRIYYYNVQQDPARNPEGHREQQEFLDTLRKTPYMELRLGTTKMAAGIPVERGIDIMIATDLLYFAWKDSYDVAILVSGDSDFAYAVQTVKNMGKHVEVAYFQSGGSRELANVADKSEMLDRHFFSGLWAGRGHARRRRMPVERAAPVETRAAFESRVGQPPSPAYGEYGGPPGGQST